MELKSIFKYIAMIAIVALLAVSCKKAAFDINKTPNQPTDNTIEYNVILPAALNNTGRVVALRWGWLQNYLSYWARSGTYAPNNEEETYALTSNFAPSGAIWSACYDNLFDYQVMENKAKVAGADFYVGIAKIMKAHNYAMLVDIYNNVPYTQALKGSDNVTPVYDKGLDIYKDLLIQLDDAVYLIKNATNSTTGPNKNIVNDDIMFSTSTATISTANIDALKVKWGMFANTLKLRLLVHLMNGGILSPTTTVSGINITNEIAKINANGYGYLTAGINAELQPGYKSDKPNPFYATFYKDAAGTATANNVYYKANETGLTLYSDNSDPRITRFYETGTGGMVGVKYGLPPTTANAAAVLAGIGPGVYKAADKPQWVLTSAESYFLQAEAMNRGFITGGNAKIAMENGITESFVALGLTSSQVGTYLSFNATYPDVDYNALPLTAGLAPGGLYTIISQKWLALNAIAPFEVWTDYRRVDQSSAVKHFVYGVSGGHGVVPQISVYPGNTKTEIPVRLSYPQTEYNYNSANVVSQGTINPSTSKIFWDLN
jgi:Starch-binding associating with outer membrane